MQDPSALSFARPWPRLPLPLEQKDRSSTFRSRRGLPVLSDNRTTVLYVPLLSAAVHRRLDHVYDVSANGPENEPFQANPSLPLSLAASPRQIRRGLPTALPTIGVASGTAQHTRAFAGAGIVGSASLTTLRAHLLSPLFALLSSLLLSTLTAVRTCLQSDCSLYHSSLPGRI